MQLKAWIKKTGTKYTVLAEKCGFDIETGRRYVNGLRIPRREHAIALYRFTRGAWTPNDSYNLPRLRHRRAA